MHKSIGLIDVQAEIANAGELIEQQKQDVETGIVRAWLEHPDMVPDKNAVHTYEPGIQQLWAQKESLEITTPWAIKKRATFIFFITLANIDGFS